MPENPSDPPHFKATVSLLRGAGFRVRRLASTRPFKGSANGLGKHVRFKTGLLLFKHQHRLVQGRVPLAKRIHQDGRLRVLAAETQHRGAGNIWMMDVTGKQTAERLRILPRAPATALMHQEPYSVDIGKNPLRSTASIRALRGARTLMMLFDQLPHLLAVKFRPPVTKLFLEGIAQRFDIAVFAKDQRNHQPVIARAHLAVGTMVTVKSARRPTRDVGRSPGVFAYLGAKTGGVMLHVARAEQAAARDRLADQPDNSAIHDDLVADGEITDGKLLLGRYIGERHILLPGESDGFPGG